MKKTGTRGRRDLKRYEQQYSLLKKRIESLGYVLQGSINERWMLCGKPGCGCRTDPDRRHGPYYQLSWKEGGKTVSVYLNEEQVRLCNEWIANNRELENIISRMRNISRGIARIEKIVIK